MNSREAAAVLERRLVHLEGKVAEKESKGWRGTSYDRQEIAAIRVALRELASKDA